MVVGVQPGRRAAADDERHTGRKVLFGNNVWLTGTQLFTSVFRKAPLRVASFTLGQHGERVRRSGQNSPANVGTDGKMGTKRQNRASAPLVLRDLRDLRAKLRETARRRRALTAAGVCEDEATGGRCVLFRGADVGSHGGRAARRRSRILPPRPSFEGGLFNCNYTSLMWTYTVYFSRGHALRKVGTDTKASFSREVKIHPLIYHGHLR